MIDIDCALVMYKKACCGKWVAVGATVEHTDEDTPDVCSCSAKNLGQSKLRNYRPNVEADTAAFIAFAHDVFPDMISELKMLRGENEKKRKKDPLVAENKKISVQISKEKKKNLSLKRTADGLLKERDNIRLKLEQEIEALKARESVVLKENGSLRARLNQELKELRSQIEAQRGDRFEKLFSHHTFVVDYWEKRAKSEGWAVDDAPKAFEG